MVTWTCCFNPDLLNRTKVKSYLQTWKGCLKNTTKWYPSLHKGFCVHVQVINNPWSKCEKGLSLCVPQDVFIKYLWSECLSYKLLVYDCWLHEAWMCKDPSLTLAQMFLLSKQFTQWDETLRKLEAPKQVQLTD